MSMSRLRRWRNCRRNLGFKSSRRKLRKSNSVLKF